MVVFAGPIIAIAYGWHWSIIHDGFYGNDEEAGWTLQAAVLVAAALGAQTILFSGIIGSAQAFEQLELIFIKLGHEAIKHLLENLKTIEDKSELKNNNICRENPLKDILEKAKGLLKFQKETNEVYASLNLFLSSYYRV